MGRLTHADLNVLNLNSRFNPFASAVSVQSSACGSCFVVCDTASALFESRSSVSRLCSSLISRGSEVEGSVFDEKVGAGVGGGGAGGCGELDDMLEYADACAYTAGFVRLCNARQCLLLRKRSVRRGARIAGLGDHAAVGRDCGWPK